MPIEYQPCQCVEAKATMPGCDPVASQPFAVDSVEMIPSPGSWVPEIGEIDNELVVKMIQQQILDNGSVYASFDVYDDFSFFFRRPENTKSVYRRRWGSSKGGHAVVIVGWGVKHAGDISTPYWLIRNSWGTDWADHGYFRIIRGMNECKIEQDVGYPVMKKSKDIQIQAGSSAIRKLKTLTHLQISGEPRFFFEST